MNLTCLIEELAMRWVVYVRVLVGVLVSKLYVGIYRLL